MNSALPLDAVPSGTCSICSSSIDFSISIEVRSSFLSCCIVPESVDLWWYVLLLVSCFSEFASFCETLGDAMLIQGRLDESRTGIIYVYDRGLLKYKNERERDKRKQVRRKRKKRERKRFQWTLSYELAEFKFSDRWKGLGTENKSMRFSLLFFLKRQDETHIDVVSSGSAGRHSYFPFFSNA